MTESCLDKSFFVDDAGVEFQLTITKADGTARDISAATTVTVIAIKRNTAVEIALAGSFVTDGTDGKIKATKAAGDLATAGTYRLRGYAEFASGDKFTSVGYIDVKAKADNT